MNFFIKRIIPHLYQEKMKTYFFFFICFCSTCCCCFFFVVVFYCLISCLCFLISSTDTHFNGFLSSIPTFGARDKTIQTNDTIKAFIPQPMDDNIFSYFLLYIIPNKSCFMIIRLIIQCFKHFQ